MVPDLIKSSSSQSGISPRWWQISHAVSLILAAFLELGMKLHWLVVLTGGISFVILIVSGYTKGEWGRKFGIPNSVTLFRLLGVLGLGVLGTYLLWYIVILFCIFLLITDGVDGWIAKRLHQTTLFGDHFDRETDSFFTLILSLLLIHSNLVGTWIVIAGLLRYITVIVNHLVPHTPSEYRWGAARVIYVIAIGLMLIPFFPIPGMATPAAVAAVILLLTSFSRDYQWMFSHR